ncbi:MAG: hypothetical protein M0Z94_20010 [Dehalococcoidales bacterium]|nr:hypothetical protein [Dehalococcoidales bacterium]
MVAVIVDNLREIDSLGALRQRYCTDDGSGVHPPTAKRIPNTMHQGDQRRVEDAAFGLRWLTLAHGIHLDLNR